MKIYSNEIIKIKLNRKKKIQKIFFIFMNVILGLLVLFSLNICYQKIIEKKENVDFLGFTPYTILSDSMYPNLKKGDIIFIKKVKEMQIFENDIITFIDESGNTITHRVIKVITSDDSIFYETQGDNNISTDSGVRSIDVIKGKYYFKISQLGKVTNFILSPIGMIFLIIFIVFIYLLKSRNTDKKNARHLIREKYKNKL